MGLDVSTSVFPLAWKDQGAQMGENRLDKFYQSILGGHPSRERTSPPILSNKIVKSHSIRLSKQLRYNKEISRDKTVLGKEDG